MEFGGRFLERAFLLCVAKGTCLRGLKKGIVHSPKESQSTGWFVFESGKVPLAVNSTVVSGQTSPWISDTERKRGEKNLELLFYVLVCLTRSENPVRWNLKKKNEGRRIKIKAPKFEWSLQLTNISLMTR